MPIVADRHFLPGIDNVNMTSSLMACRLQVMQAHAGLHRRSLRIGDAVNWPTMSRLPRMTMRLASPHASTNSVTETLLALQSASA